MAFDRRQFLKSAGAATLAPAREAGRGVTIVIDPADVVAGAAPAQWAARELRDALSGRGVRVNVRQRASEAAGDLIILAAGANAPAAREILSSAGVRVAEVREALALVPGKAGILACGYDAAGLAYALLELADRVRNAADPLAALSLRAAISERPANAIRAISRLFTSDVEDKPWFNDREMWPRYLTMLAAQRFNRFQLSLGIGYDFLRNVTDGYFLFAYPFLLSVPGYNVRVPQLTDAERDRNLDTLKFIGEQTVARGIEFQLGIWMHGYEWIDSPNPNYTIEGLTAKTHGPYCRDAVRALLKACPAIGGVTFRVHGESGVAEGSYDFWKTVFEGVVTCGRTVEIDMHSKGMDPGMLELAVATGLPVKISPKYWAEHMGMPYHQAEIRGVERPRPGAQATGLMKFSAGSRSFTRYGYADLLREDRRWGVLHRIWPGTQRLLLWGDPLTAAAHSRAFSFCGSDGVDVMEPLSFKGRRGSGIAGGRCAYADGSLKPRWDWQKYAYSYRVWGRLLYNPEADPDTWRRSLRKDFGAAAADAEAALANASRILPIVTTAHGASAGNNTYWPEVYTNHSMIDAARPGPYTDSPAPKVFGNVSPMDPQLFSRINDFADGLLAGERSGKYSPIEVAQWLEDYAAAAAGRLAKAEAAVTGRNRPEWRRLSIDVSIQAGLGRFFGAKLRSGVLFRIYERTGDRAALEEALKAYRSARGAWAELSDRAKGVYVPDITVGERAWLRGHWLDRLPAIDQDIAALERMLTQAKPAEVNARASLAIKEAMVRPVRAGAACQHTPPARFRRGEAVEIAISVAKEPASVRLYYRHVNQAERYENAEMQARGGRWSATIPAAYTDSPYPLEYYFEVGDGPEAKWLYPGFGPKLTNQPYFVVRQVLPRAATRLRT